MRPQSSSIIQRGRKVDPGRVGSGEAEKARWGRQQRRHRQCSTGKNGGGAAGLLERRPTSSPPPGARKEAPGSIAPPPLGGSPKCRERRQHRRAPVQHFVSLSSKPSLLRSVFPPSAPRGDVSPTRRQSGGLRWGRFKEEKPAERSGAARGLRQRSGERLKVWSGTGTEPDAHIRGQALQRTTHGASLVPPPPSNALPQQRTHGHGRVLDAARRNSSPRSSEGAKRRQSLGSGGFSGRESSREFWNKCRVQASLLLLLVQLFRPKDYCQKTSFIL